VPLSARTVKSIAGLQATTAGAADSRLPQAARQPKSGSLRSSRATRLTIPASLLQWADQAIDP
jgi:hypothetical protein